MTITGLAKKLRLHTAQRALILNPPEGYRDALGQPEIPIHTNSETAADFDFVHLFIKNRAELDRMIDQALAAVTYDGLLWISYPKGSSGVETDINRDSLWEALKEKGIRPVMQVSIDSTWSALRFRPAEAVGT